MRLGWLALLLMISVDAAASRPRVAVVVSDRLDIYESPVRPFIDALGQPVLQRNLSGREAVATAVISELKSQNIEVVFAIGAKAAYAVRQQLPNTPMVYAMVQSPGRYGISGRQVTGVRATVPAVTLLSQFQGFFPGVKTIGVLRGPFMTEPQVLELQAAARDVGVTLQVVPAANPRELRRGFHTLASEVDAIYVGADREMLSPESWRTLTEETRRRRLPLLVDSDNMVRAGGLFTVVPDPEALGKQAAATVQRLLDGSSPAIIETQDPEGALVVLNLTTLKRAALEVDELLVDFVDVKVE